jgi:predicted nucleotidyltransferase
MTTVHYIAASAKRRLIQQLRRLLAQRPEMHFACVHGSFLLPRGGFRDIDIAVWIEASSALPESALEYGWALSSYLERHVEHPIDVRVLNWASLGFRYAASSGTLLFAKDRVLWYNFREETWNEYLDFAPLSTQMLFDLLEVSPHPLPAE